ncbi:MAG: glucosaminidase domain-containing protein [Rhodospirillaceae bacterium]|nr:glucosaminidase domain-containing protein [Rhodospirillaceae bacterium]
MNISSLRTVLTKRAMVALAAAAVCVTVIGVVFFQRSGPLTDLGQRWHVEVGTDDAPLVVANLEEAFASIDYDIARVRQGQGVPRVLVRSIPDDLGQVPEVQRRKSLFLGSVLPLVLAVNEQIMRERAKVEAAARKLRFQEKLTGDDLAQLERLAKVYEVIGEPVESEDPPVDFATLNLTDVTDELLLRVAPLPVSLVLAQAAEESAWGLSRFAAEGNALYGQWVWNDEAGIVPKGRRVGETHSVRAFNDIYESTLSYAHNLNTHRAYKNFRHMRANMLNARGALDGHVLAGTLTKYSGRGQAYVESLRSIIRANDLAALDRAVFADRQNSQTVALAAQPTKTL